MSHMPRRTVTVWLTVVGLAACTGGGGPTTTTLAAPTTTTTTVATPPTTRPPSTTTTTTAAVGLPDLEGIVFPTDPATVEDLPALLTAPIGAPMPDPDLTVAGPADAERWVAEWVGWMAWARANPEQSKEAVAVGWIPDTPMFADTVAGLEQSAADGRRVLGWPFYPISVSGTFDQAFADRQVLNLIVVADGRIPTYTIDAAGAVVDVRPPFDTQPTLRLVLRPDEEEEWRVESIEVSG